MSDSSTSSEVILLDSLQGKRRRKGERYRDFCMLPPQVEDEVVFLGGKGYFSLFCSITSSIQSRRTVFFNSAFPLDAPGCTLRKLSTSTRTNWHYECANFLRGSRCHLARISMQIVLNPNATKRTELRDIYSRALDEAEELYIASAYLTDWDASYKLGSACKRVVFLVGTDFGLTRKAAMLNVLRWIPKRISFSFSAVQSQSGGFHPKLVAWKTHSGECHCLIGSSNLSKAAFSDNYEANVMTDVSSLDFARLCAWLDSVSAYSSPISKDWIKHHYKEAQISYKGRKADHRVIQLKQTDLPRGRACAQAVQQRRQQQAAFQKIGKSIRIAAARCSQGKISRSQFWQEFWDLWAHHKSRFQGSGLQFAGKAANWQEACGALIRILEARKSSSNRLRKKAEML
jgi:hypothetical protein